MVSSDDLNLVIPPTPGQLRFINFCLASISPPYDPNTPDPLAISDGGANLFRPSLRVPKIYSDTLHNYVKASWIENFAAPTPQALRKTTLKFIKDHQRLLNLDKVIYYFPFKFALRMITPYLDTKERVMQNISINVSRIFGCNVFLHCSYGHKFFRVGQILDRDDHFNVREFTYFGAAFSKIPESAYMREGGRRPRLTPEGDVARLAADQAAAALAPPATTSAERAALVWHPGVQYDTVKAANDDDCQMVIEDCQMIVEEKIPKPKNSWILYRLDNYQRVKKNNPELSTAMISKILGQEWKSLPAYKVREYTVKAEIEKQNHKSKYPEYKCKPRKSSQIKRRQSKKVIGFDLKSNLTNSDNVFLAPVHSTLFDIKSLDAMIRMPSNDDLLNGIKFGTDDLFTF